MNTHLILSIFSNESDSDAATNELETNGIDIKDISVLMKGEKIPNEVKERTKTAATTGGVIGGIAGILAGIGAITIPGVGLILIGGPLATSLGLTGATAIAAATTVTGGVAGAVAGGLLGSLIGLGLSENEAKLYETSIKEGAILVGVGTPEYRLDTVKKILTSHNGKEIKIIQIQEPGNITSTFNS